MPGLAPKLAQGSRRKARVRKRGQSVDLRRVDVYAREWPKLHPRRHPNTTEHNAQMVRRFAKTFKGRELASIDRVEALRWANYPSHRGAARYVRTMFNDAKKDGLVETNPFAGLGLPRSNGRAGMEMRVAEFEPLVWELAGWAQAEGLAGLSRMIVVAAFTGCRVSELCNARREHVLYDGARLVVRPKQTVRSGGSREVVVPPCARAALMDSEGGNRGGRVFGWRPKRGEAKALDRSVVAKWMKRLSAEAGRPEVTFHFLRHFAASWLVEQGVSPFDAAVQLHGHGDPRLVLGLYSHVEQKSSLKRLGDSLESRERQDARTALQRAHSAFVAGDIDVDEFERRTADALARMREEEVAP